MDRPDVRKHHSLKKGISEHTARYWLNHINFRWTLEPSGQYIDGHEREDVVYYFLPHWKKLESKLCGWTQEGKEDISDGERPQPQWLVVWFHDESTFYAHDRCKRHWVHSSETATP